MAKTRCVSLSVCAILLISSAARAQTESEPTRVPEWSLGVGVGLLPVLYYGLGAFVPAGFVSLERRLGDAQALDLQLAGHYSEHDSAFGKAHRGAGRLGVGVRQFFLTRAPVRPSAFLLASALIIHEDYVGAPEHKLWALGAELGAALDAELSEAILLRFESPLLSLQRARTNFDGSWHPDSAFAVGLSPRAELRMSF